MGAPEAFRCCVCSAERLLPQSRLESVRVGALIPPLVIIAYEGRKSLDSHLNPHFIDLSLLWRTSKSSE